MKGKRTGIDFSEHILETKKQDNHTVYHFRKPGTYMDSIMYINTYGIMAVTGDYGNWIFCREFHPTEKERVSDQYWCEKLSISSTQVYEKYDPEETAKRIKEHIEHGLEEYGWEGDRLDTMKSYLHDCLEYVDEEERYKVFAYDNLPSFTDYESIIICNEVKPWLKVVFDGFDEICRRMKEEVEILNNQGV
jgi:hypothetical protein